MRNLPLRLGVVHHGDCLVLLRRLPAGCIDAVVTDPPAGIGFMGKDWDTFAERQIRDEAGRHVARDRFIEWLSVIAEELLRVCKPGAHALVWALPRTSHWTAMAFENAGWEIRDRVSHLFGQGFPKSLDVSKAIDKYGAVEEAVPEDARAWAGWGTALKPACEDWWLCRKPLDGTVAANVLKHGTGALNVDGCRIATGDNLNGGAYSGGVRPTSAMGCTGEVGGANSMLEKGGGRLPPEAFSQPSGRWPANLVLSHTPECKLVGIRKVRAIAGTAQGRMAGKQSGVYGGYKGVPDRAGNPCGYGNADGMETVEAWECVPDCPVRMLDEQSVERKAGGVVKGTEPSTTGQHGIYGHFDRVASRSYSDVGGASRFFYTAKAASSERSAQGRVKNKHPTVKPLALMRWLCRLITPPDGIVLDPFAGSGTTLVAAKLEGFRFLGMEQDEESVATANGRIAAAKEDVGEMPKSEAKPGQQIGLLARDGEK